MAAHRRRQLTTAQALQEILADSDSDLSDLTDSDSDDEDHSGVDDRNDEEVDEPMDDARPEWVRLVGVEDYVPIWCPAYTNRPGPVLPEMPGGSHPLDYFLLLFPDEAFQLMTTMTNNYALHFFDNPAELPLNSRFNNWFDCSLGEMKAFVGIQIAMSLCSKPRVKDYWSHSGILRTSGFQEVMSRNRYQLISSFLHFSDNENRIPRGQPGHDPLSKVSPLINIVKPLCQRYYIPQRELSVDETMRKFKGRLYCRQYMPNKPIKRGIKIWSLCESKTGYLLNFDVYMGKTNIPAEPEVGLGHSVVMRLMDSYLNLGHFLFMDNFYSSPALFDVLNEQQTGACGTVRANRVGLPVDLKPGQTKLKKGDDPVYFRKNDMLACAWHDTARVHFLSTIDDNGSSMKQIRSKHSETGFRDIQKPNVASTYNKSMGGVDLFDQKAAMYPYPHKMKKWYQVLYHFIVDVALINSFILFKASNPTTNMDSEGYREQVAEKLCAASPRPNKFKKGRKSLDKENDPERLTGRHFPFLFPDPKYKPNCVVCSFNQVVPKRKQTRYGCRECFNANGVNTAMCVPECFIRYHTLKHYKNFC